MQTCDPTICHPCAINKRTMLQMSSTEKKTTIVKQLTQSNVTHVWIIAIKIVQKEPKKG